MIPVSERSHLNRLKSRNLVINDYFVYQNEKMNKIFVRSSDGIKNDNVLNAYRSEKEYYLNGKLICTLKNFDKNTKYTFILNKNTDEMFECPNCGYTAKSSEFFDECPFCNSAFNVDYKTSKYSVTTVLQEVVREPVFKVVVFIVAIIFLVAGILNNDFPEAWHSIYVLYLIIMFPVLLFTSYMACIMCATPLFFYRVIKNSNRYDWVEFARKRGVEIDKSNFYKDFQVALKNYYYGSEKYIDLIDFDILDYDGYFVKVVDKDNVYVTIRFKVRKLFLKNNKIKKRVNKAKIKFKRNNDYIKSDAKTTKCDNCGAAISIYDKNCKYCKSKITNKTNEWYISEVIKD